jgi:hypothetical protein
LFRRPEAGLILAASDVDLGLTATIVDFIFDRSDAGDGGLRSCRQGHHQADPGKCNWAR